MTRLHLLSASIVLFVVCASTSLASAQTERDGTAQWAQVEATGTNDVALLVAIEDYAYLPDVPGARGNVADWSSFLADKLGVPRIHRIADQQATREGILEMARRAASEAKPGSTLWFLFIGHGAPSVDGSEGLLVGADGQQNPSSLAARGVPQKELLEALQKGEQARTIIVLDACFSGRDSSGATLAPGVMPVVAINALPTLSGKTVVLTAAKADQFAGDLPGQGRPAFSYLLLSAMAGLADSGQSGRVTASEAVKFADAELFRIPSRQQTPQLLGEGTEVLSKGTLPPPPAVTEAAPVKQPPVMVAQNEPPAISRPVPPDAVSEPAATQPESDAARAPLTTVLTPAVQSENSYASAQPVKTKKHVPQSPLFFSVDVGLPVGSQAEFAPVFTGQLGVKLNHFYQSRYGVRAFGLGHIYWEPNPNLPEIGDSLNYWDDTTIIYDGTGDEPDDRMTTIAILGGGLGISYRTGSGDDTMVLSVSGGAGYALPLSKRCTDYEMTILDDVECESGEEGTTDFDQSKYVAFFGRAQFSFSSWHLAVHLAEVNSGTSGGLQAGFGFDM